MDLVCEYIPRPAQILSYTILVKRIFDNGEFKINSRVFLVCNDVINNLK